ncbi:MAG: sulfur oxidation c-type cytochrome SoxA [Acidiphilium sp.]|nr:sulfur oxidation c-type cytochrome SoxA [Acidiphilium sp.]MDD4934633.1 sulfur oxidation c-type cytochrome SoxA [Acidiphilium sp.]
MRLAFIALALTVSAPLAQAASQPDPAADMKAFQGYFLKQFPKLPLAAYVNGPYNFSKSESDQWKQIMEFPPYQFAVDDGKKLFETKFPDGKTYASCFPNGGIGIAQNYPMFDAKTGKVVTLGIAINRCRVANGQKKLKLTVGPLADISAYMTSTSDGKPINVVIPHNPKALAAYEAGKEYFYTRRGQLNFSCASCHVQAAGMHLRGDVLSPALGLTAAFPLYRSSWGDMGTLVRRFIGCNQKVKSEPSKPDSTAYRDLAYFMTYMDNGLPESGPGARP